MIYFVGTGVGGVDYLTVKAYNILKKADIVLFTPVIDKSILKICKKNCQFIDYKFTVDKEIINIFRTKQKEKIVYLTNGDFSIFGFCQNHFDFCKKEHIPFEIVPGIPVFSVASSVLANECLLPNISNCFTITYLEKGGSILPKQDLVNIARIHGTIVVYMMNPEQIPILQDKLLEGGFEEDTPVIVVKKVLREDQYIKYTTIRNLQEVEPFVNSLTIYLIGWVFADIDIRNSIAKTPFVSNFQKTEYYNMTGVFSHKLTDKIEGISDFSIIKNRNLPVNKK